MIFYGIIGMHFIHVMVTACMIHASIFITKYGNKSEICNISHNLNNNFTFNI